MRIREGRHAYRAGRQFEGKRFSGPNDVVVKSNGAVYFTDSVSGLRGAGASPQRELPFNGFYLVKDGKVTLLDEKLRDPQVAGNTFRTGSPCRPTRRHLYVTFGRKIMRYDINADDTVGNPVEFADVPGQRRHEDRSGGQPLLDLGRRGPARCGSHRRTGKRLGVLQLPQRGGEPRQQVCATNVAFGDADEQDAVHHGLHGRLPHPPQVPGTRPGQR